MRKSIETVEGATMVEAAVAIAILFLFIGGIFDFGLGLYQYNFLNYTTTRAAREISAKLSVSRDCNEIERYIRNVAYGDMAAAMSAGANTTWTWLTAFRGNGVGGKKLYNLQLTGRLPLNCYFICNILPKDWAISSTVSAAIETPFSGVNPPCEPGGPEP